MRPTILTEEQVDFVLDNFTFKKNAAECLKRKYNIYKQQVNDIV